MVSEDAACQQGAGSGYEGEADGDLTLAEGVAAELVDTTGPGATVDEDRLRQENKKRLRFSRASSQVRDHETHTLLLHVSVQLAAHGTTQHSDDSSAGWYSTGL